ncbi:MAG: diguanylate cyclase [Rhodoferax sp.]|nr:diguanylate cyclase [Rhodoferax sp.]
MKNWLHLWRWWLLLGLFWALVAAGLTAYSRSSRDQIIARELDRLAIQTKVVEDNLTRQLTAIDAILRAIAQVVPHWQRNPAEKTQGMQTLRNMEVAMPAVRTFLVLDRRGEISLSNRAELVGRNFASRDYFQAPRNKPSLRTLYASAPFKSVLGNYVINLSRVVQDTQGQFAGVVSAGMDSQDGNILLNSVRYSPDMLAMLVHGGGALFISEPSQEGLFGVNLAAPGAMLAPVLAANATLAVRQAALPGQTALHLVAMRRIAPVELAMDQPLFVVLTRPRQSVLAIWRQDVISLAAVVILLAMTSMLALSLIQRQRAQKIMESKRLKLATEASQVGIWEFDLVTRIYQWDAAMFRLFGLDPKNASPRNDEWIKLLSAADLQRMRDATRDTIRQDKPFKMTFQICRPDGQVRYMRNRAALYCDDQGVPRRLIGATEDVTQRKQQEADLRVAAVAFESNESMLVTNAQVAVLRVNQACVRLFGYSVAEMVGQHPRKLKSGRHDLGFYQAMWQQLLAQHHWQGEIWNRHQDGHEILCWLCITAVCDDAGKVTHYVANHTDITSRKASEEEVRQMAFFDPLTQLPNRRLLQDRLQQAMAQARRDGTCLALMYVDLDKFKPVNDLQGHAAGDQLLKDVAQRLQWCLRESDTAARVGGDEFVLLLPVISQCSDALEVAKKIHAQLRLPFTLSDGQMVQISASTGVAIFPEHGADEATLSLHADVAMYHAKAAGRDQFVLYHDGLES